jgi:transcriptional regulator with XRE-family HTH domain
METSMPSTGDWFGNRNASTGAPSLNCVSRYALAATLLIGAGTGAFIDDLDWLRHSQDYRAISRSFQVYTYTRTPIEDIARIREVFSPAVSDLAKVFSVSRQAIYNWLNGERPSPDHITRLQDFALAADMFVDTAISMKGELLKRKIVEGKNMLEIVHDGGSAREAAQLLLQIVRREISQREKLAARFAGRTTTIRSADSDLMEENDAV